MRSNNLNLLRLVAAFLVLYAHSFDFLGLTHRPNILGMSYGGFGVNVFFVISGYLITRSWEYDPNILRFLYKRCLRIFPGLFVVIVLSALIYGPLMTTLSLRDYFNHPAFLFYFRNLALYPVYYLPGVLEKAVIPNAVNGSLWSLPVEFYLYLNVLFIGFIFQSNKILYLLMTIVFAIMIIFWVPNAPFTVIYGVDVKQVYLAGIFFLIGAVHYKFKLERYYTLSGVVIACFALAFFSHFNQLRLPSLWLFLPYIILSFGFSTCWLGGLVNKLGDYSYGVYIYAFPTQQAVLYAYPDISLFAYVFISSIITLFFAVLSWHYIEEPFLSMKPK